MWLPYLQRAGRRFVIITRDRVPAEALAGLTDVPVIESPADRRPGRHGGAVDPRRVLRQRVVRERRLRPLPPAHPRLPRSRRLRQAALLQPDPRDVRPGLRRRSGRHPAVRRPRGADPGRRSSGWSGGRRPRTSQRTDRAIGDGRAAGGALRPDLEGARRGDDALLAARGGADRGRAAGPGSDGHLPAAPVQLRGPEPTPRPSPGSRRCSPPTPRRPAGPPVGRGGGDGPRRSSTA